MPGGIANCGGCASGFRATAPIAPAIQVQTPTYPLPSASGVSGPATVGGDDVFGPRTTAAPAAPCGCSGTGHGVRVLVALVVLYFAIKGVTS
jgi:hypothetical protein